MKANRPHLPITRFVQGGLGLAVMAMLASCVGPPQSAPAPRPVPPPRAAYVPPAPPAARLGWRDAAITPGDWHWAREGGDSVSRFGAPGASALVLRCDAGGRRVLIDLAVSGQVVPQTAAVTVTTSSQTRALTGQMRGGWLEVPLGARDSLLDAMAFSRGRFMVEAQGLAPLYVPSWPEVSRVVEDCRQG